MVIFRLRYDVQGDHVHCRLFQADGPGQTWQKNGDIVFDAAGWAAFIAVAKDRMEIVKDEPTEDQ